MTDYQPGQRVRLVHTNDPYSQLRPGDTGTVLHYYPLIATVIVAWDNGYRLLMRLDDGDGITPLTDPTVRISTPISTPDPAAPVVVRLWHTPRLQVPNRRIRLGKMRQERALTGPIWAGALLFDHVWAATVVDDGSGLRITEYSPYAGFGRGGMQDYLAGCRLDGAPVTEQRLLTALADEYRVAAALCDAATHDGAAIRLVDATGHTRALRPLVPAPRDPDDLLRVAGRLAAKSWRRRAPGESREVWTGTGWATLPHTRWLRGNRRSPQ